MKKTLLLWAALTAGFLINAQIVRLDADGSTNTYDLINSVLAPGANAIETPDCAHPEFGPHITQVYDTTLQKYVFAFHIHVTPDNDRCQKFDRQRNEIKTYASSPDYLIGFYGDTVRYEWMMKLPKGFKATKNFSHLHQIKAVGGDDDMPIFTLTARTVSSRQVVDLIHNNTGYTTRVDSSKFIDKWVKIVETIVVDSIKGSIDFRITDYKTGSTIFSYKNDSLMTIRSDNDFIRPKWGIYRSKLDSTNLRDEILHYAGFGLSKETIKSQDNSLKSLTIIPDSALTPAFHPDILNYNVVFPYAVQQITINAQKNHDSAAISGTGSFGLNVGDTSFIIKVFAENGDVRNYTLFVRRLSATASSDATLRSLTVIPDSSMFPAFHKDSLQYRVSYPYAVSQITINAQVNDSQASLMGIGTFGIKVGDTSFTVKVTAQSGQTRNYTIFVNRDESSVSNDATLKSLNIIPDSSLTPAFHKDSLFYKVTYPVAVSLITIQAVANSEKASIQGNDSYHLQQGENNYKITVKAESGDSLVYNILVIRSSASSTQAESGKEVKIYPNPVKDILYLENTADDSIFRIYNLSGVLLLETKQQTIDLSALKAGIYILEINGHQRVKLIKTN